MNSLIYHELKLILKFEFEFTINVIKKSSIVFWVSFEKLIKLNLYY